MKEQELIPHMIPDVRWQVPASLQELVLSTFNQSAEPLCEEDLYTIVSLSDTGLLEGALQREAQLQKESVGKSIRRRQILAFSILIAEHNGFESGAKLLKKITGLQNKDAEKLVFFKVPLCEAHLSITDLSVLKAILSWDRLLVGKYNAFLLIEHFVDSIYKGEDAADRVKVLVEHPLLSPLPHMVSPRDHLLCNSHRRDNRNDDVLTKVIEYGVKMYENPVFLYIYFKNTFAPHWYDVGYFEAFGRACLKYKRVLAMSHFYFYRPPRFIHAGSDWDWIQLINDNDKWEVPPQVLYLMLIDKFFGNHFLGSVSEASLTDFIMTPYTRELLTPDYVQYKIILPNTTLPPPASDQTGSLQQTFFQIYMKQEYRLHNQERSLALRYFKDLVPDRMRADLIAHFRPLHYFTAYLELVKIWPEDQSALLYFLP